MTVTEDVAPSATAVVRPPATASSASACSAARTPGCVTGHGTYVDDIVVPGMLHVAFVRSDVARGAITALDVAAARELPGVVAVLHRRRSQRRRRRGAGSTSTGRRRAGVRSGFWPTATCASSASRSPSSSPSRATSPRTPATSSRSRSTPSMPSSATTPRWPTGPVPCTPSGRTTSPDTIPPGDDPELDEVFAKAAHVITETFHQHRYVCVPMESPRRGLALGRVPQRARGAHRRPRARTACAGSCRRALGLPENRVRVVMQRRRRRVRAEDVHAARRGRRRARRQARSGAR